MNWLLIYWSIDCMALCVAMIVVPGIYMPNNIISLVIVVGLFGVVNTLVRPLFWLLTCPIVLVMVAPLILALNVVILWFSAWLTSFLGLGFTIQGFIPAIFGAIIVSGVRVIAVRIVQGQQRKQVSRQERVWLDNLERYKIWLEQERSNWRHLAEERERILQEQSTTISYFQPSNDCLEKMQDQDQFVAEVEQPNASWRGRIYLVLYRWHDPFYDWYMRRGWTWIIPVKEKIKQTLLG